MKKIDPTLFRLMIYGLTILLLIGCFTDMPYGYYFFARLCICALFAGIGVMAYESNEKIEVIACLLVIVLFNPLFKAPIGEDMWRWIDGIMIAICSIMVLRLFGAPTSKSRIK